MLRNSTFWLQGGGFSSFCIATRNCRRYASSGDSLPTVSALFVLLQTASASFEHVTEESVSALFVLLPCPALPEESRKCLACFSSFCIATKERNCCESSPSLECFNSICIATDTVYFGSQVSRPLAFQFSLYCYPAARTKHSVCGHDNWRFQFSLYCYWGCSSCSDFFTINLVSILFVLLLNMTQRYNQCADQLFQFSLYCYRCVFWLSGGWR